MVLYNITNMTIIKKYCCFLVENDVCAGWSSEAYTSHGGRGVTFNFTKYRPQSSSKQVHSHHYEYGCAPPYLPVDYCCAGECIHLACIPANRSERCLMTLRQITCLRSQPSCFLPLSRWLHTFPPDSTHCQCLLPEVWGVLPYFVYEVLCYAIYL